MLSFFILHRLKYELTWETIVGLCSRIRSIIARAAPLRALLDDFEATVRGYINA